MNATPDGFYWSLERQDCFQTCLRRYYYRYYSTAGVVRQVAGLRHRAQWAEHWRRRTAHAWLREALSVEAAADRLLQSLRDDFRASRRRGYRAVPKTTDGLFEHEYEIAVPDTEWKTLADRAVAELESFCRSPYASDAAAVPNIDRLAVGETLRFDLLGLEVEILADMAVKNSGQTVMHHWLGHSDIAARRLSRAALAWLATVRWSAAFGSITLIEHIFPSGPTEEVQFSPEDLEAGRELIHDAADEMRYPLADPERNLAREEDFALTEDEHTCRACPFLKLCAKWR